MTTILVNGTFDILHRGHLELLEYAKSLGGTLIVAIDTDRRVKELKGLTRPINNQDDRWFMLKSLKFVDHVYFFDSDEELIKIIKKFKPVMVKGSDYQDKSIIGKNECKEIKFFERIDGYSTTNVIQHITDR
jgi:D-beta-D-heptose 7-phosphate kinase/D-beta-D-heptose 1-phosphate adenosyltransferase